VGSTSPNLDRLTCMAALAAVRLVLVPSIEAGVRTPASFSLTEHVTVVQLEERRTNPAAARFAFLLDSGAVVGHLMTADAARFDPTSPAAISSDPAELPPNTQEYYAWLLSNVGDPATVHDAQEAYQRAMRQPTVSGPNTTWLPVCASCGLCTPSLEVAERRLTTWRVSAFSVDEAVEFAASPPLRQLVALPLAVGKIRYFLHPELVTGRLPHSAGAADAGAGAPPNTASAGLAPPPAWRARIDGALGMTAASAPAAAKPQASHQRGPGMRQRGAGRGRGGGKKMTAPSWAAQAPGDFGRRGHSLPRNPPPPPPLAIPPSPTVMSTCASAAPAHHSNHPPLPLTHTHNTRRSGTRRSHAVGCARIH
jgi:hypothetical protein